MKPLRAKNQVRLGAARCLQLALSGMSYRMFRSTVTVSILALAVAFLVHMLGYGILSGEAQRSARAELGRSRQLGQYVTRLTTPDTHPAIRLALATGPERRAAEYFAWTAMTPDEFERARETARFLHQVEQYLTSLPPAARAVLLGDLAAEELYDRLQERRAFDEFSRQFQGLNLSLPGKTLAQLRVALLERRPQLEQTVSRAAKGHARAIEAIAQAFAGRTPQQLAANPPDGFAEALRGAGFSFPDTELEPLMTFAQRTRDLQALSRAVLDSRTRAAIARETRLPVGDVSFEAVADYVDTEGRAEWLVGVFRSTGSPVQLSAERLSELLEDYRREQQLGAAIDEPAASEPAGLLGLSTRIQLLIALSFLVCVVGVANAMLMSVTERFTEIATMKCLGAMDRFVMGMFVFEAVIQGLVGGVVGVVLGLTLAVLRGLIDYGTLLAGASGALGTVAGAAGASAGVGVLLAALAAVGPSWIAARLAPMEAMRVD
jgi:hypothetical protein